MLQVRSTCALASLFVLLAACGGGGDGAGGGVRRGTPPTISDLTFAPSAAFHAVNGMANVTGRLSFVAPDGNLATLRLTSSAGDNLSSPLPSGYTSGQLSGELSVSTATVGHYTFDVWVTDANGNSSNHLGSAFDVLPAIGHVWTPRTSPTTADLNKVAWSGARFVAVGSAGTILTSSDGAVWTTVASGTTNSLNGVAWTGNRFVAVGDGGTVLASADGTVWTSSTVGQPVRLNAAAGSTGQLVVAGENAIYSSSDGIAWTQRVHGAAGWVFQALAWSGTTFVAVGGEPFAGWGGVIVWTSRDGLAWESMQLGTSNVRNLADVTWSGSRFVAVGQGTAAISADGVTWQLFGRNVSAQPPPFDFDASGIASDGRSFIAVSKQPFGQIARSVDGLFWNQLTPAPHPGPASGIAWGGGQFVAVGTQGGIYTSP